MTDKVTSKARAAVFLRAAFVALKEAGGSLPLRDLKREIASRVELNDHDRAVYEKSGYVRWQSVLHFYSIDCVKAGFLRKANGVWHLTPEGEATLAEPPVEVLQRAMKLYRAWKARQPVVQAETDDRESDESETSFVLETAQSEARAEIQRYVESLGPYEYQDLVAALLRAMGYSTPFIAPKGPDGGTDILAYPDPLGAKTPHIRVQVKHRASQKATRDEIASLRGIVRQDREIGLFVSTSGFTSDAVREAGQGAVHIQLMDLDQLLALWIEHYDRMDEDEKSNLRLSPVYFLAED